MTGFRKSRSRECPALLERRRVAKIIRKLEWVVSTKLMMHISRTKRTATETGEEPPKKRSKAEETALKKQSDLLFKLKKDLDKHLTKKQLTTVMEMNGLKIPAGVSAMQEW